MQQSNGVSWGITWRRTAGLLAGVTLAAGLVAPVVHAEDTSTTGSTTTATSTIERVIVRFGPNADAAAIVGAHGGTVVQSMSTLQSVIADVPSSAVEALRTTAGVIEVAPDSGLQLVERDPEDVPTAAEVAEGRGNPNQFVADDFGKVDHGNSFEALTVDELGKIIGADKAHEKGATGAGIDVAVIDTGIAPVPGLAADRVVNGPDLSFDSQFEDVRHLDTNGHGTHLAGIMAGLAPESRLVNVKVGATNGAVDVSQVIAAIDWVVQHRNDNGMNIRVLNLAYGTQNVQDYTIDPLSYAAEVAWRHGIVVVAATGNAGAQFDRVTNPAVDPRIIAVGASEAHGTYNTADDTVAAFSSRSTTGRTADLVAPGRSVVSHRTPGSYVDTLHPEGQVDATRFRGSGTSQSAAVTSAAAAMLLDANPALTPDEVKKALTSTAKKLPRSASTSQGAGILDVDKAVQRAGVVKDAAQAHPYATGTGTLEGARGSSHVEKDGVVLTGEYDIHGTSWSGTSWSGTSWSGTSWSGGVWNGTSWSGTSWSGTSWSGTSWSGTSWSGTSWSGTSWSGTSWSSTENWSGTSWSGTSWSGTSWSGTSWSGTSWSGTSWSGTSWSGTSWSGTSWS